jgi:uncharacterized protein YjbJ (UPF0337 family)
MNKTIVKGKFSQLKGAIKEKWGQLTDDDLALLDGSKDKFFGRLQEKYGIGQDEAQKELDAMDQKEKGF